MKRNCIFLLTALMTFCFSGTQAQSTAQWRGKDRHGVYDEKNLLEKWPEGGPVLLWSMKEIGNGFGSPAVTTDRIYITGEKDSTAFLFCLDLKGNQLWRSDFGKEWVKTFPGSRSTPTVVNDLVYVASGIGNLACLDAKTGQKKWFIDMVKELHGRFTFHGLSESPLVNGDLVYLVPGGRDTNVVAFNRFSGKIVWINKGLGQEPAYNSPILITLPERKILVTFTAYALLGLDAATGELLFNHEQVNIPIAEREPGNGDTHSNSCWYEDGFIYYFAGDGNGAVKLKLSEGGKKIEQVWRNKKVDNYMGGFIKEGKYLYSCLFEKQMLVSLDAETGNISDSLKIGRGNLIAGGDRLYYYNLKGEVSLVKPVGAKLERVSMFKITEGSKEHFAHLVIHDGVLYVRHGNTLLAYRIN